MWWLGFLIAGAVAAAVTGAVVYGIITKKKIREQMEWYGIKRAIIRSIDKCSNVVTLKDLENDNIIEVQGDGISSEITRNDIIRL